MSQPPAIVTVGPHRYEIVKDDGRISDEGANGKHYPDRLAIVYSTDPHPAKLQEVILHEVMHALLTAAGLDQELDDDHTESVARRVTPFLLETLRANPDLVAYLVADQR